MYKTTFLAALPYDESDHIMKVYKRDLELPFVPLPGMHFKIDGQMWKTENGEISCPLYEVVYDLQDERFYCLFNSNHELTSGFWKAIDPSEAEEFLKILDMY